MAPIFQNKQTLERLIYRETHYHFRQKKKFKKKKSIDKGWGRPQYFTVGGEGGKVEKKERPWTLLAGGKRKQGTECTILFYPTNKNSRKQKKG